MKKKAELCLLALVVLGLYSPTSISRAEDVATRIEDVITQGVYVDGGVGFITVVLNRGDASVKLEVTPISEGFKFEHIENFTKDDRTYVVLGKISKTGSPVPTCERLNLNISITRGSESLHHKEVQVLVLSANYFENIESNITYLKKVAERLERKIHLANETMSDELGRQRTLTLTSLATSLASLTLATLLLVAMKRAKRSQPIFGL